MLVNLKDILADASKKRYAIPCINTPNEETVRAVVGAAEELNAPIIIDHAQVHDSLIPIERIGPVMLKYAREASVPVCVHLDHGSDYTFLMRALRVGFPSIMYDCSALPFDENAKRVKEFTEIAHKLGITVEAELGIMASAGEDTHSTDPEKRALTNEDIKKFFTDPDQAAKFADITGCDALAVSIGTAHGVYKGEPKLDLDRLSEIREVVDIPLVLHGTSGVPNQTVSECVKRGICKVNYATDLRIAFTKGVTRKLAEDPGTIDPKKYNAYGMEEVKQYVMDKMQVCGCAGKATA